MKRIAAMLALVWACETVVPNQPPVVAGPIPDQEMGLGDTVVVDLDLVFHDPEDDTLMFTARSRGGVATAVNGSILGVAAVSAGVDTISVTATDPDGASATASARVTVVNRPPEVTSPIRDQRMFRGDTRTFDAVRVFDDPDGEPLTYSAMSSDTSTVRTEVAGSDLRIVAVTKGVASVLVSATDAAGAFAEDEFNVEIPNRAPRVRATMRKRRVAVETTVTLPLGDYFGDPDADELVYEATVTNQGALEVSVSNDTLFLDGLEIGEAAVSVTAADDDGAEVSQEFDASVVDSLARLWEDDFNRAGPGDDWRRGGDGSGSVRISDSTRLRVELAGGSDYSARARPFEVEEQWAVLTEVLMDDEDEDVCASVEMPVEHDDLRRWSLDLDWSFSVFEIHVRDRRGVWHLLYEGDYEFEYGEVYELGWRLEGDSMHVSIDGTTEASFDPVEDGEEWPADDITLPTNFRGVHLGVIPCGFSSAGAAEFDRVKVRGRD
ncbi:MAG: hypothetical protein OXQ94_05850 [Gemmatimonadota bacterium]|nr:hypothetical protein [Gemmatimonadota bacterium]MDE2871195.1 hypothetical protein [Gemmatimonadota bacterium]